MLADKYKFMLIEIINRYLPSAKIYLFGSRAKSSCDSGSDIDLALDAGKKIEIKVLLDIADAISESTIPYFVDLVDVRAVDEAFYASIKKDLIPWK